MGEEYFGRVRSEIKPLLPPPSNIKRIVDVGCGKGATSKWLRSIYPESTMAGIEVNEALRPVLETVFDEVYISDVSRTIPDFGTSDLMLFLDVLEHVPDPVAVLRAFVQRLSPNGTVIVSVPNVAHFSVAAPLFVLGRFRYADSGILDRTHLRFFVRETALRLLNDSGLVVVKGLNAGVGNPKSSLVDRLTIGALRNRLTRQFIMAGTPMTNGRGQDKIPWSVVRSGHRNA